VERAGDQPVLNGVQTAGHPGGEIAGSGNELFDDQGDDPGNQQQTPDENHDRRQPGPPIVVDKEPFHRVEQRAQQQCDGYRDADLGDVAEPVVQDGERGHHHQEPPGPRGGKAHPGGHGVDIGTSFRVTDRRGGGNWFAVIGWAIRG